ncbi:MAG TPA: DUF72 domain-containing protein [Microscillaceae bacterium]|nr:DUF72 domain-containing protein [Microscillaceae bacterium]
MKFGKLTDVSKVDFSIPADAPGTERILAKNIQPASSSPKVYVGCPIWSNKSWVGTLYPKRTPANQYLTHYARQFNTIELNSTHYSVPNADTIKKWQTQSTPDFRFSPKVPQEISHKLMPLGKAQDFTKVFVKAMEGLGEKLGISFMQLSPYFTPQDMGYLAQYLQEFPAHIPLAVEFRHEHWFQQDHFEKATQLLESHQVATVITDVAGRRDALHMRLTTPDLVLRFVGNNLHPTDYQRADDWVNRIQSWLKQGLQSAYIFIHQPDENEATPELALYFVRQLNEKCGLNLQEPKIYRPPVQGSLF